MVKLAKYYMDVIDTDKLDEEKYLSRYEKLKYYLDEKQMVSVEFLSLPLLMHGGPICITLCLSVCM